MRIYTSTQKDNKDFDAEYSALMDEHSGSVGVTYSPVFDRDTQEWVPGWIITLDGVPQ